MTIKVAILLSNPYMVDPRVQAEAHALHDAGHNVSVLVWDRQGEYSKYSYDDGVIVHRLRNKDILRYGNDSIRNPFWWRAAYKWLNERDFDVVHCNDLDTLPAGVKAKKTQPDMKVVFDAHEIFRYMLRKTAPRMVEQAAAWLERRCLPHVDHVITVSEPFKRYYQHRYGGQISLVRNYKTPIERYIPPGNDVLTLVYIGLMAKERFFPDILDVVESIPDVNLILAGKKERMYHEIESISDRYHSVDFRGTIPSKDIFPLTMQADATFILVDPSYIHHRMTLYNKQFEAMANGRPYIVPHGTYSGWLTEKLGVGVRTRYNRKDITDTIIYLRDNRGVCREMGEQGLQLSKERYNWEHERKTLMQVYEHIDEQIQTEKVKHHIRRTHT